MLKIDSNGVIKLSKGDDCKFPLFLNQGTVTSPIRYEFTGNYGKFSYIAPKIKEAKINQNKLKELITESGTYIFTYNGTAWTFESEVIDLGDYGISITMRWSPDTQEEYELEEGDMLKLVFTAADGCEVYFNIYDINCKEPLFTKTFKSDNCLWLGNNDQLDPNGDMKIELLHTDLLADGETTLGDLKPGEYVYQINAKLLDKYYLNLGEKEYVNMAVTNKIRFYYIDDEITRDWN